jgi:hypothetical protein
MDELDFVQYIGANLAKKPEKGRMYGMKSSTSGATGLHRENELYTIQFIFTKTSLPD